MKIFRTVALLSLSAALTLGCSAKTKEEAKEALEATGEAAKAAAEDTKANVKKAGEVLEAGVDSAKEKADELRTDSPPGDSPADADAVPEIEEPAPQDTNP
jgi:hypothetical protein